MTIPNPLPWVEGDPIPRVPKYCTTCGKRLVERTVAVRYDAYTGEERKITDRTCPDASRYSIDCRKETQ